MFKDVLKREWISANGKWKVVAKVQEQTIGDEKFYVSSINVMSFVRENVWRSENQNRKLPKYVQSEYQKAKDIVANVRKGSVTV